MALFSRKKEAEGDKKAEVKKTPAVAGKQLPTDQDYSSTLIKPRITEKAVKMGDKNVYTFVVAPSATKKEVAKAVETVFKVTPIKVNIVNKAPRQFMSRSKGRTISKSGMKKAYVYLKAGDSIELA